MCTCIGVIHRVGLTVYSFLLLLNYDKLPDNMTSGVWKEWYVDTCDGSGSALG